MMISFFATIRITVLGTLISMIFNVLGGYAMSKNTLPGHKIIFKFMIFTMFFSGGLAPTYLLIKNLHMLNTIWSLTLPMSISTYNLILMKNFFAGMNPSIEEAAKIDGYNDVQILIRIILPLSKPAIAAISLFYAVGYWNDYFRALIYVSSKNLVPFQLFLRDLVIVNVAAAKIGVNMGPSAYEQFKMAVIIIGMLPVVIAYPFVQKYFTKGIILGSTKE
jgi:putative aldouronate transport system permease protein